MKQYLEVGKLNNTHGVKGELKLQLWCDGIEYLKQFKTLYLDVCWLPCSQGAKMQFFPVFSCR